MTVSKLNIDPTRRDLGYGKLALIGLCIVFLTVAIAKQLPAHPVDLSWHLLGPIPDVLIVRIETPAEGDRYAR
jgi:hypothetical protein